MRLTIWVLLLFYYQNLWGFINIESLRQDIKKGFYGSSGLSLTGSSGNVDVFNVGTNSRNILKQGNHESIVILNYKYGEAKGVKNSNDGDVHLRYAQDIISGLQLEIFTQLEFNEFQNLSLRSLVGGGMRFQLFDDQKNSLYLGLGTFYEDEKINNDFDQSNFRGNLYLSFRNRLIKTIETVVVAYFQPSYDIITDYRLQFNLGFELEVLESLKWSNEFSYAMDSVPPLGIEKRDVGFKIGFNYEY